MQLLNDIVAVPVSDAGPSDKLAALEPVSCMAAAGTRGRSDAHGGVRSCGQLCRPSRRELSRSPAKHDSKAICERLERCCFYCCCCLLLCPLTDRMRSPSTEEVMTTNTPRALFHRVAERQPRSSVHVRASFPPLRGFIPRRCRRPLCGRAEGWPGVQHASARLQRRGLRATCGGA